MTSAVVNIQGLQVRAGARVLLDLPSLRIEGGERVALMGHNGAGKSTLMRLLGGFAPAHTGPARIEVRGELQVLGRQLNPPLRGRPLRALGQELGQVLQGLHLVPRLSVRENVLIGALPRLSGWRSWTRLYPPALLAEADAALDELGLLALAAQRTDRLSGGERQKLGIARLSLQSARLILADEPSAHLDPSAALAACSWLQQAAARSTPTTVVHQPALLPPLADRVLGLHGGRLLLDRRRADHSASDWEQVLAPLYDTPMPVVGSPVAPARFPQPALPR